MNASPYRPDRSLLLAIGLLVGGAVLCAGGVYILSFLSLDTTDGGTEYASVRDETPVPPRPATNASRPARRSSPLAGGRAPAWAQSTPSPRRSIRPVPQAAYEVNPDYGHADLGAPPAFSGMRPSTGAAEIEETGSSSAGVNAGRGSLTVDFGGGASGGGHEWRASASILNSRLRALSRAFARMDGANGSLQPPGSRAGGHRSGGEASTASSGPGPNDTGSAPGPPEDPNQVPLGGTEWLAAAGAAYALNRLRTEEGEDDESEGES